MASFNGTNGSKPNAGVIFDAAGNLYGTTGGGGAGGDGTVFEIAKGSTAVTTLASFNGTNGVDPDGVTFDAAGNLYGTTLGGGPHGDGTVFELAATGSTGVTTLASFNGQNGEDPLGPLSEDADGNLFGTAAYGPVTGPGDLGKGDGVVFEIVKGTATVYLLAAFDGTNGANPEGGLILDPGGNLYGTTGGGGANGTGTAFEIARGRFTVTTLASFDVENGHNPVAGVTLDPDGDIYGTTSAGGTGGQGTVYEIPSGSTTANTIASFNGQNGANPQAPVAVDSAGNVYGMTSYTVFEIARGSSTVTTLASFSGLQGTDYPQGGVVLDAAGNLYGTTYVGGLNSYGTVFEIPKGSTTVVTLASFYGPNGANPGGVTIDAAGNLYGTTTGGGPNGDGTIFEIANGSFTVTTLASFDGTNGANPGGRLTLDAAGNLYGTTGAGNGTVFEIAKGSTAVTTLASFNGTNGALPDGLTLGAAGNLYGTTRGGGPNGTGTVFEILKGSDAVTTLASFNGANGLYPHGLTLDAAGNLYGTVEYGGPGSITYGTVFKLSPALPGDANEDGKVDFSDLLSLAQHYGMNNATWSDGDFNDDGTIDFADLLILA